MKHVILTSLLLLASLLGSCTANNTADTGTDTTAPDAAQTTAEQTTDTEAAPPAAVLLFEDNFDGTELDSTKFMRCPEWKRQGELCIWDEDMSYLDGEGHLVLRADWDEKKGRVRSGGVRSDGIFTAGYAYYEASIAFPVAYGIWGAFWMMCGDVYSEDGSAADGVEIDIIESIHNQRGVCNSAMHWDGYGDAHKTLNTGDMTDYDIYDGNFHTFGLERLETGYVFYIDGKETWRVGADECEPCPEQGYLKLTVEAADWSGAGTEDAIAALPAEMYVDYVRVYSEKPAE